MYTAAICSCEVTQLSSLSFFLFFTSFKSELKQNSNFDGLYFKHKYLLLHGWYTYIGSHAATNKF